MVRLQKIELLPDGSTTRGTIYLEKSSLVSITENTNLSEMLGTPSRKLCISTIIYSTGSSQRLVDIIGSPDMIHNLFESGNTQKGSKGLLYG